MDGPRHSRREWAVMVYYAPRTPVPVQASYWSGDVTECISTIDWLQSFGLQTYCFQQVPGSANLVFGQSPILRSGEVYEVPPRRWIVRREVIKPHPVAYDILTDVVFWERYTHVTHPPGLDVVPLPEEDEGDVPLQPERGPVTDSNLHDKGWTKESLVYARGKLRTIRTMAESIKVPSNTEWRDDLLATINEGLDDLEADEAALDGRIVWGVLGQSDRMVPALFTTEVAALRHAQEQQQGEGVVVSYVVRE